MSKGGRRGGGSCKSLSPPPRKVSLQIESLRGRREEGNQRGKEEGRKGRGCGVEEHIKQVLFDEESRRR